MTFQEAKRELAELAKGKYHSINYELSIYPSGSKEVECRVYVEGYKFAHGKTWREALDEMREKVGESKIVPSEEPKEEGI